MKINEKDFAYFELRFNGVCIRHFDLYTARGGFIRSRGACQLVGVKQNGAEILIDSRG